MAATKPKRRRRKIPYIGKRRTASEIAAEIAVKYPLPPKMEALFDRIYEEIRAERPLGRRKPRTLSAKTARAK